MVPLLTAVLVRIHIQLVSCLWFWLAHYDKALLLELLDLVTFEVSGFFFRFRVGARSFDLLLHLFLILRSVCPLFTSLLVVTPALASSLSLVLALFSVVVLSSIGSVVFPGLWPIFPRLLVLSLLGLLRLLCLLWLWHFSWSRGWADVLRRLLINYRNGDFFYNSIMNPFDYFDFFGLSFIISGLLMNDHDLVSMYNCSFGLF